VSLSNHIFDDTPADFFGVLTLRYGRYYIDALDKIEERQRLRHGVGITREELIDLCQRVIDAGSLSNVEAGAEVAGSEEGGEPEEKITAAAMLRYMLKCNWLEEPRRNDYLRVYYLDNRAEILLDCLRKMAYPENVTFTDKLHLVCSRIQDAEAFTTHPLSDLESCMDNLRYGLQDIGQRCYKSLVDLDIPIRLPLVREKLDEIQNSPTVVAQMEIELQKRRPELTDQEVTERISRNLKEAMVMLESVEPQSEAVDRRAADFARRSFARFRYLQEVSSGRRSEVRSVFELINERYADCKMASLPEDLDLPKLNIPSVGLLSGTDSLFIPRTTRAKGERVPLTEYMDYDADSEFAMDEMADNINSSLTTLRANDYYHSLKVPKKGLRSDKLKIESEEDILDIVGLLLHDFDEFKIKPGKK